jgi:hypothetical protein
LLTSFRLFDNRQLIRCILFLVVPIKLTMVVMNYTIVGMIFTVVLCFGHSLMGVTMFLSSLLPSHHIVSGYVVVILTCALTPLVSLLHNASIWSNGIFLFPPLTYLRALHLAIQYDDSIIAENDEHDMTILLDMLVVMGIIWGVIGVSINTLKYQWKW